MLTCKKNNFNNRIITNTSSLVEGGDGPEKPSNSISSKKIKKKDKKDNPIYLVIKKKKSNEKVPTTKKSRANNYYTQNITRSFKYLSMSCEIILTKHAQERIEERILDPKLKDFHKLLRKLKIRGRHFQQLFDSEPNTPSAYYAIKLPNIKVESGGGLLIVRKRGNALTVVTLKPGTKCHDTDKIVELKYY